jgi:glycosyltransferase involved in cell wall biosynthesis
MSGGIPVLGNVPSSSDAYKIIKETGCGYIVEPGNPKIIAKTIIDMYKSDQKSLKEIGMKGRKFVEKNFSSEMAVLKFEKIFERLKVDDKYE